MYFYRERDLGGWGAMAGGRAKIGSKVLVWLMEKYLGDEWMNGVLIKDGIG